MAVTPTPPLSPALTPVQPRTPVPPLDFHNLQTPTQLQTPTDIGVEKKTFSTVYIQPQKGPTQLQTPIQLRTPTDTSATRKPFSKVYIQSRKARLENFPEGLIHAVGGEQAFKALPIILTLPPHPANLTDFHSIDFLKPSDLRTPIAIGIYDTMPFIAYRVDIFAAGRCSCLPSTLVYSTVQTLMFDDKNKVYRIGGTGPITGNDRGEIASPDFKALNSFLVQREVFVMETEPVGCHSRLCNIFSLCCYKKPNLISHPQ